MNGHVRFSPAAIPALGRLLPRSGNQPTCQLSLASVLRLTRSLRARSLRQNAPMRAIEDITGPSLLGNPLGSASPCNSA